MRQPYPYALSFGRYRELLSSEFEALAALIDGTLAVPVPSCPGWSGEDLVRHTAIVYLQKAETIRTGSRPGKGWPPVGIGSMPPGALLWHCYERLIAQFDAHDPDDAAESWVPGDQTVGFWVRRLTHETAMHRYDLELAGGGPTTAFDADLAVDGIDEVLSVMLGRGRADPAASGAVVLVESAGRSWSVSLEQAAARLDRTPVAEGGAADSAAPDTAASTVRGAPQEVLLWLWGRGTLPSSSISGDAVSELRSRLARAL
ncbi:maleylpyruvate isomerase family mycothiol-dependent enzyme [Arthrobacter sp. Br18]|uniref:maleylpyruvate isomerase family mycothiol-dependent enzyme n=1 Tax=Arthrobacter sp. Br18 TaxID=1312954 RepID=UPI0004B3FA3E|nr:maleylpyruvate isomerase family mycothiol-dependent enzyme [Arthrobacter sp. Br18]